MKYKICYMNDHSGACHKYTIEGEKDNVYLVRRVTHSIRFDGSPCVCLGAQVPLSKERVFDIGEEEV